MFISHAWPIGMLLPLANVSAHPTYFDRDNWPLCFYEWTKPSDQIERRTLIYIEMRNLDRGLLYWPMFVALPLTFAMVKWEWHTMLSHCTNHIFFPQQQWTFRLKPHVIGKLMKHINTLVISLSLLLQSAQRVICCLLATHHGSLPIGLLNCGSIIYMWENSGSLLVEFLSDSHWLSG